MTSPQSQQSKSSRILLWYRGDLRLHDHEAFNAILDQGSHPFPCYIFDSRQWGETPLGFPKIGPHRAKFLLETVADLRRSLQQLGSDLILRRGSPEMMIPQLCEQWHIEAVYYSGEVTREELDQEAALHQALQAKNISWRRFWSHSLIHPDDLPFAVEQLPDLFTQFRKQVEKVNPWRDPLPPPKVLPAVVGDRGEIPTLQDLGLGDPPQDDRAVLAFQGGEAAALQRLEDYFFRGDHLCHYKETRNGLLGANYSSKFSPWLALGCLSPRRIFQAVKQYEKERIANDSTYWLIFELLWRDYFYFVAQKYGDRLFYGSGLQRIAVPWKKDPERFEKWRLGETGFPWVDANMRELLFTGFMSNRGRQNVASFLTKNLGIDWRWGAQWFESQLMDYDVCSNWGNWAYAAGVGNDARGFRYFHLPKQARTYDPQGDYMRHWLPELRQLPGDRIHDPHRLSPEEQRRYHCRLGGDYPRPLVDLAKSVQHNQALYEQACPW